MSARRTSTTLTFELAVTLPPGATIGKMSSFILAAVLNASELGHEDTKIAPKDLQIRLLSRSTTYITTERNSK